MNLPRIPPGRALPLVLLGLALVQVMAVLTWVRPGPLSIDEILYQWMTRSVAAGHLLTVANGYDAFPSPELATTAFMYAGEGGLTSQYPPFFPWLAAPFYALLGFAGVFLVNALAWVAVVALTWRIGLRLTGDRAVALLGAAVFAVGTFGWEYSVAAWPHMVTLLTQVGAFALMLEALLGDAGPATGMAAGDSGPATGMAAGDSGPATAAAGDGGPAEALNRRGAARRRAWAGRRAWAAGGAGFVLAVGVGFRRDAVFFLPVLALPLLYHRPVRGRELVALGLGSLPPLAVLSASNWARWGVLSPLSYGRPQNWGALAVVGVAGLVGLALLSSRPVQAFLLRHLKPVVLAALVLTLIAFWAPPTRPLALGFASGMEGLVWDLRGTAVEFGAGRQWYYWAVMYLGMLKKSLVQSLPWLPLAAVPLILAVRRPDLRWKAALLLLPAAAYILPQAIYERHGGMSANLRYFIPTLPFFAILAARGMAEVAGAVAGAVRGAALAEAARGTAVPEAVSGTAVPEAVSGTVAPVDPWRRTGSLAAAGAVAAALVWLVVRPAGFETPADARLAALDLPLVLAVATGALVAWWGAAWWKDRPRRRPAVALAVVFGACVAWSALLTFDYDARWARLVRSTNLVRSYELSQLVEPGALVFTSYQDWHGTLPELVEGVSVAFPRGDDFDDFRRLALHHLDTGRPVYGALMTHDWNTVRARGMLRGLELRVVAEEGAMRVAELRRGE